MHLSLFSGLGWRYELTAAGAVGNWFRAFSSAFSGDLQCVLLGSIAALGSRVGSRTWAPLGLQRIEASAASSTLGLTLQSPRARAATVMDGLRLGE